MFFAVSSSKTTLTDYQCVSTGCCTHIAKTEITIDNQYVTKSLQRYRILPKQPKENTEKNQDNAILKISPFFFVPLPLEPATPLNDAQMCGSFYFVILLSAKQTLT